MSTDVGTLPEWGRRSVYWFGGLLFAAGIGMSGWSLTALAVAFGIPNPFALTLPLALDAGAAFGVVMWVAGSGEVEKFGRNVARMMFFLSLVGNGLERAIAFRDLPAAELLDRWVLITASIGIGVTFPVLAYTTAHGLLLARRSADAPISKHSRRPAAAEAATRTARWWQRKTEATPAFTPVPVAAAATSRPAQVHVPAAKRDQPSQDQATVPVPAVPGGETKTERANRYILAEWDAGRAVTGKQVEEHIGAKPGSGLGRQRLRAMRDEHPGREPGGSGSPAGGGVTADDSRVNGTAVPELVTAGAGER